MTEEEEEECEHNYEVTSTSGCVTFYQCTKCGDSFFHYRLLAGE